ncbi:MAG: hypothetical protein EOO09_08130 [Chitinophagaceae bacterium]|nr:MAG: hypothetical protein EOO09_08130 [Chitinophagaceae bacterium]
MKKYFLVSLAIAGAGVLSIFGVTKNSDSLKNDALFADMFFIYQLSDVPTTDANYENAANWVYSASTPAFCETNGNATCFIKVNSALLTSSGTETQRLATYLAAQSDARITVNALRQDTKASDD